MYVASDCESNQGPYGGLSKLRRWKPSNAGYQACDRADAPSPPLNSGDCLHPTLPDLFTEERGVRLAEETILDAYVVLECVSFNTSRPCVKPGETVRRECCVDADGNPTRAGAGGCANSAGFSNQASHGGGGRRLSREKQGSYM